MDVKNSVTDLILQTGTNDPAVICDCLHIKTMYWPLEEMRGYFYQNENGRVIVLNRDLDDQSERFVRAHEIGHLILHGGLNRVFLDTRTFLNAARYEKQADAFAACLLYPNDDEFLASGNTLSVLAASTGLREDVVKLRIGQITRRAGAF